MSLSSHYKKLAATALIGGVGVLAVCAVVSYTKSRQKKARVRKALASADNSNKPPTKTYHHPSPPNNTSVDADFLEGDTIVLSDTVNGGSPSKSEIERVGRAVGVTVEIAKKLLVEELPSGWKVCKLVEINHSEDELASDSLDIHSIYYFNFDTGESSWDHPLVAKYRAEQDEKTKARLANLSKQKRENAEHDKQKVVKKKERMARRLSALNKKPISLEQMFTDKDEVTLTSNIIMESFDTNKDGALSKKEFTNGLRGADPKSTVGKQLISIFGVNWRVKSDIVRIFNEIDEDGNGELSLIELRKFVERMDESSDAHRAIVARRGSTVADNSSEKLVFDKYKNENGKLDINNFEKVWKEMGAQAGKPFSDKQCQKWAGKTMKRLANLSDAEFDVEDGASFEDFKTLSASGPLFEIVTKRM
ncbi:hypothetical protein TrLO_g10692 [Triparma laevis f. longispina]|uniref:Uncharacterized protein n=1 Tax=Triparma laevis f. longispina TaxID=1714387 RepID=A0A9W7KTJ3_9STRA|nr:hypothetical protein TrLO_g10692 [Triparma laevis f. longispina]